ncbi:L-threonylcarbamoyladenylate synthase [Larkinella arboricola]|uniref:Threonylcarbamoyl-AMP synthase n=1 Tax=Larkinella arboricola TaxID=643671 RepID=A0A327WLV4_LARAB|nr:L-threonylcarbamoyladenylate synthase [Larkinella arboricola]RAJ92497.1 L-threonylcarbamoyladenylate synthase [Larkinella arboricola]
MVLVGTDVQKAKEFLEQGEVIGLPTETVYGLAGNALNPDAVLKIFKVKNRPSFDPLIVHTDSLDKAETFVTAIPEKARRVAERFWPGPVTILLPKKAVIPDLVSSGLDTVAIRIPNHPLALKLLSVLDFPLAAPSANPFGYISPTTARHVVQQLGDQIPYVLDGGSAQVGIESTIIGFSDDGPIVYRLGGMTLEKLEAVLGKVAVRSHSTSNPKAPGMLSSHYAPRKPLLLKTPQEILKTHKPERIGVLAFDELTRLIPLENQQILSVTGDLNEAAKNLFAAMRALDALDVDVIVADLLPEMGLGRAVNDRLRRAAFK